MLIMRTMIDGTYGCRMLADWMGSELVRRDLCCWLSGPEASGYNALLIGNQLRANHQLITVLADREEVVVLIDRQQMSGQAIAAATLHASIPVRVDGDLRDELLLARHNQHLFAQLVVEDLPLQAAAVIADDLSIHRGLTSLRANTLTSGLKQLLQAIAEANEDNDPSLAAPLLARAWPLIIGVETDHSGFPTISGIWQSITDDSSYGRDHELGIRSSQLISISDELELLPLWGGRPLAKIHDPITPSWWVIH
jgi:hypothetical protein